MSCLDILFHCNHTILVTFRNEREGGREGGEEERDKETEKERDGREGEDRQ